MRKFTFIIAAIATLLFTVDVVKAQTQTGNAWRMGIGLETAWPTQESSNFQLGGTVRIQYDLPNNVSLTLTPGYYHFFAKDGYGTDLNMVPVKAGLKSFFVPHFYISAEAGAGFELDHEKNTKLILAPGIGYAGSKGLDLALRYENFSGQSRNYGMIGLRVAYGFKL